MRSKSSRWIRWISQQDFFYFPLHKTAPFGPQCFNAILWFFFFYFNDSHLLKFNTIKLSSLQQNNTHLLTGGGGKSTLTAASQNQTQRRGLNKLDSPKGNSQVTPEGKIAYWSWAAADEHEKWAAHAFPFYAIGIKSLFKVNGGFGSGWPKFNEQLVLKLSKTLILSKPQSSDLPLWSPYRCHRGSARGAIHLPNGQ